MKYKKLVILSIGAYLWCLFLSITFLIGKYSLMDFTYIEPKEYMPERAFNSSKPGEMINYSCFGNPLLPSNPEEKKLMVLLGDSIFFGYGLKDDETI